jgi:transmembrane sensor
MRKPLHPISALIIKKLEGTITPLERQTLDQWISASKENKDLFEELCDEYRMSQDLSEHSEDKRATWAKIISMAPELDEAPVKRIPWMRYVGVAAVLLLTGMGVWYFALNNNNKVSVAKTNKNQYKNDIAAPTGNNAVLTLADGKSINLDDVNSGQLAEQGIMEVVKQADGTIEYRKSEAGGLKSEVAYNTISTNRGGKYKIVLADNSVVWLNSVSSLKYPTAFTGDERVVELTGGEAYFEIAKSTLPGKPGVAPKRRPFIVKLNGMQVEVLR